jgi:sodium-dependent phosphate cotransporter
VFFPLQVATDFLGKASSLLSRIIVMEGLEAANPLRAAVKPAVGALTDLSGESGAIMLGTAAVLLFISLRYIVVVLRMLVIGRVERFFDRTLFRSSLTALAFGVVLTVMVQSSSISTSLVVPLAGAGILTLRQIFPFTLGANVGTTLTAMMAAFVTGSPAAVTVAFAHFLFNVFGIVLVWPMRTVPIRLAEGLAGMAARSRIIPLLYVATVFYGIPLLLVFVTR